jgi:hypothetical protein
MTPEIASHVHEQDEGEELPSLVDSASRIKRKAGFKAVQGLIWSADFAALMVLLKAALVWPVNVVAS